ncbi:MAG: thioredoxin family protein, partial [Bacteroidales bacterium]|nr:thioredoxin family protein [Bacteroidales bacterium]
AEHKNVLIQIGGNWCPWCIRLHKFFETNVKADSLIKEGYVFLLINYSKENKNLHILKKLDYPQRFGFPVLVVLNNKGVRIHTQDTGLLEEGSGYDEKKVIGFLKNWTIMALDDKLYNK